MGKISIICAFGLISSAVSAQENESSTFQSFPHKLIFSDTPEIGRKWRGGIRNNDIVIWDINWNINNWFLIDILAAGITGMEIDNARITDRFSLFTIKSKPYSHQLHAGLYKAAGGIKVYEADTDIETDGSGQEDFWPADNSFMFFAAQGFSRNRHYFNLFTSLSFREKQLAGGDTKTQYTFYLTPGYRFRLGKHWNVALENYMTNSEKLPIKVLQYGWDEDRMEFWNPDRKIYSFMFWGFHYARKHIRIDLNFASHYTLQGPKAPMLGIGWHF